MEPEPPDDWTPTFDEPPLAEVLRTLEALVARGRVAV